MDGKMKELYDVAMAMAEKAKHINVDAMEASDAPMAFDMLKDITKAYKNCKEAEYYERVTEAMETKGTMPARDINELIADVMAHISAKSATMTPPEREAIKEQLKETIQMF